MSVSSLLVKNARVAVVGGSMAGTSAAIALRAFVSDISVFERTETFHDRGHGIGLPLPILQKLQAEQFLKEDYTYPSVQDRRWYVKDPNTSDTFGRHVWTQNMAAAGMTLHHWGILHEQLCQEVGSNLHLGVDVNVDDIDLDDPASVALHDRNGNDLGNFDLVIAADGVNSELRSRIVPDKKPEQSGYVAWRASFPLQRIQDLPVDTLWTRDNMDILTAVFPGGQLIAYAMPHDGRNLFNIVFFAPSPSTITFDGGKGIREIPSEALDELYQMSDLYLPPFFRRVLEAARDDLFLQPIVDENPSTIIHPSNRLLLMGDSAATLRPHTASGTVKAFQDAFCLQALAKENPTLQEFCQAYDEQRVTEAQTLVELGQHLGRRQILEPPDWYNMTEEEYGAWWLDMVSNTSFAYKASEKK